MESRYMVGHNFTIKFPPDFHYYTGLNGLVNSFYYFTIALSNKFILGCKPHSFAKMNKKTKNKNNIMREMFARRCSTKKLPLKLRKIHRKSALKCLSNTVKGLYAVRYATLLKRNPRTSVSEPAVRKYSLK